MEALKEKLAALRASFDALNQREQTIVLGGASGGLVLVLLMIALLVSSSISRTEHRLHVKLSQLQEILALQGEYRGRQADQNERLARLRGHSNIRLVKVVEDAARIAGVSIGTLTPEDGQPNAEGVMESRVALTASDLSINALQGFLQRLEDTPGIVVVQRLKVDKPHHKETLNIELTVTTYKVRS